MGESLFCLVTGQFGWSYWCPGISEWTCAESLAGNQGGIFINRKNMGKKKERRKRISESSFFFPTGNNQTCGSGLWHFNTWACEAGQQFMNGGAPWLLKHCDAPRLITYFVLEQVARWGADGVILGSAMVKLLGEAKSPEEGLEKLEGFTRSLKSALP